MLLTVILDLSTMAFGKLTKKELIVECQKRGLKTEGLWKPALLKMLQDHESQQAADKALNADENETGAQGQSEEGSKDQEEAESEERKEESHKIRMIHSEAFRTKAESERTKAESEKLRLEIELLRERAKLA